MGLEKAKSLLEVKNGKTFLDLIAEQIKYTRRKYDSNVSSAIEPIVCMPAVRAYNSLYPTRPPHEPMTQWCMTAAGALCSHEQLQHQ